MVLYMSGLMFKPLKLGEHETDVVVISIVDGVDYLKHIMARGCRHASIQNYTHKNLFMTITP